MYMYVIYMLIYSYLVFPLMIVARPNRNKICPLCLSHKTLQSLYSAKLMGTLRSDPLLVTGMRNRASKCSTLGWLCFHVPGRMTQ